MQRGGSDQFPIWMGSWTLFAGKLNSDVGKEFYVWLKFQIQSIGRCRRWRITVSRDDKVESSTGGLKRTSGLFGGLVVTRRHGQLSREESNNLVWRMLNSIAGSSVYRRCFTFLLKVTWSSISTTLASVDSGSMYCWTFSFLETWSSPKRSWWVL